MLPLLPLLAIAAAHPSLHADTQEAIETMLGDAVRARVAAGWTLAAVDGDSDGIAFTVTRRGLAERHVVTIGDRGDGGTYHVERTAARVDLGPEPMPMTVAAMHAPRGGVELVTDCGYWYERGYVIEQTGAGAAAGRLVARALQAADDLLEASREGDQVRFALTRDGKPAELHVTLDDRSQVLAAELRRYEWVDDHATYTRRDALERALRGGTVTAIEGEDLDGLVLVLGTGRFALDPDDDAFVEDARDPDAEGCGC